jgi:hypothetical protein
MNCLAATISSKTKSALTCDRSVVAPDAADLADLVRGAMACDDLKQAFQAEMFGVVMGEENGNSCLSLLVLGALGPSPKVA